MSEARRGGAASLNHQLLLFFSLSLRRAPRRATIQMPRVSVTPARGARPAPRLYRATAETTESARSAAETSARTDADAPLVEDAVKDVTVTVPLFTEQPSALVVVVDAPVHALEAENAVVMTDVELTV